MTRSLLVSFLGLALVACATTDEPTGPAGNAKLGIARFDITETASELSIVGSSADGAVIGHIDVQRGHYMMSAEWVEDGPPHETDGRKYTMAVLGNKSEYQGEGYSELHMPAPNGPIGTFLADDHVRPRLASWGIQFKLPPVAELDGERPYTVSGTPAYQDWAGVWGMWVSGSGIVSGPTLIHNGACTTNSDCPNTINGQPSCDTSVGQCWEYFFQDSTHGCDGKGCNICNHSGWMDARAIHTSTSLGEKPNQTLVVQACSNLNAIQVKACGGATSPATATDCGTPSGNANCFMCASYSGSFTWPYGGIWGTSTYIGIDGSTSLLPANEACGGNNACYSNSCTYQSSIGGSTCDGIPDGGACRSAPDCASGGAGGSCDGTCHAPPPPPSCDTSCSAGYYLYSGYGCLDCASWYSYCGGSESASDPQCQCAGQACGF